MTTPRAFHATRPGARQRGQRPLGAAAAHLAAVTLGTLALAASPSLPGCGDGERSFPDPAPVPVRTTTLVPAQTVATVVATGSLHGTREAVLAAKVMGTVLEIRKRAGDPVRRGEILIRLDDREVSGQIGQAEGALAQAQAAAALAAANFTRFEQLFARGAASQLELDQARYQYDTTRGAVRQAESAVAAASSYRAYADIPAPFDGRVVDRMCEVGDLAAPGRPLLQIEDARRVRLHVTLGEGKAGAARVGAPVRVIVPALERVLEGTVAEVVPAVDPATRSLLVKIDLPADPELRSGLYARAELAAGTRSALVLPRSALVERGGLNGVFVVQEGRATFRLVEVSDPTTGNPPSSEAVPGGPKPGMPPSGGAAPGCPEPGALQSGAPPSNAAVLEVLSGLSGGEQVVLEPPATLTEGAPVEVLG